MRKIVCAFLGGLMMATTAAVAQECATAPTQDALDAKTKLTQLVEDGLVQFAGYLAMVSYAKEKENCADKAIYEALYVNAKNELPNTKMFLWKNWSLSRGNFTYPKAARNDGFGGKCKITFDLQHAGTAQNVRVTCSNPLFKGAVRKWMKTVVFAPPTLSEGFTKGKGLVIEQDFGVRIDDWVF